MGFMLVTFPNSFIASSWVLRKGLLFAEEVMLELGLQGKEGFFFCFDLFVLFLLQVPFGSRVDLSC